MTDPTPDDPIVFWYTAESNPDGATLPGVPLDHLTKSAVAAFPPWIQRSIAASPLYTTQAAKPKAAKKEVGHAE